MNFAIFVVIFILAIYIGMMVMNVDTGKITSEFVAGSLVIKYRGERIIFTKHFDLEEITFLDDGYVEKVSLPRKDVKEDVYKYFKDNEKASDTLQLLTNWKAGDCAFVRFDPLCAKGLIAAQIKLSVFCEKD